MMMRVCQISVFMECRQRRRVQILLIIDKINLCPSVYSESSASGNINLTHPPHKKKGIIPMPLSLN